MDFSDGKPRANLASTNIVWISDDVENASDVRSC